MKAKKRYENIPGHTVITAENVQYIGELIAIATMKFLMRRSGHALDSLYRGLLKDIHRPMTIHATYTDGYDVAQEAICYLCNHMGRSLNEIARMDHKGKPVTIFHDCYRVTSRYVEHQRAVLYNTEAFQSDKISQLTIDIDAQTTTGQERVDAIIKAMKLKPYEEETLHCYMAGMGMVEIAHLLGKNNATIWDRRQSIRKKYRKYIQAEMCL